MPAPPPESLPAIVSAVGVSLEFPVMIANASSGSLLTHSLSQTGSRAMLRAAAVGLGVVVTAAAAQFTMPVPFSPVPITFTPLAVMLVGAALGSRLGFITQVLYLAAG